MTRLQRGDWAPAISTSDIKGELVNTADFADWGIWLAFYRYASCPMCNQHFDDVVSQHQATLAMNNIVFIAVFESEMRMFPRSLQQRSFSNVRVVTNPTHTLYDQYGVERSWVKLFKPEAAIARVKAGLAGYSEDKIDGPLDRIPAHFLILPGGIVHHARYGRSAADHLRWRDLDEFYEVVRGTRSQGSRVMPVIEIEMPDDKTVAIDPDAPPSDQPEPKLELIIDDSDDGGGNGSGTRTESN